MLDKIIVACRYLLENFYGAQECKEYLNSRLNKESQEKFQFGYFPGAKDIQVLIDLVGEDALRKHDLLYSRTIEDSLCPRNINVCYFENQPLILPYRNTYGEVVALVGRSLLKEDERRNLCISKYINTKETKKFKKGRLLFGLYENKQSIIEQDCVYLVEGQIDVIKAVEKNFTNIVGLGTNSMTDYQFSVITRYTDNLILLLDNDEGGEKGRRLITNKYGKLANIKNFFIPESYKDIDEYLSKSEDDSISFIVKG